MAIPFKADHFRFRRQAELEKELRASPLFRKIESFGGIEWARSARRHATADGFNVPPQFLSCLDEAVLAFKTAARLPYEIHVLIARDRNAISGCMAHLEDRRMTFCLPPNLLQECSAPELLYHLAVATFLEFLPVHDFLHGLLTVHPPLELGDRMKALEVLRLGRYAASCFAMVCCRDVDLVLRESFHRYIGLRPDQRTVDFDPLADHCLKHGPENLAGLLDDEYQQLTYLPVEVPVLKRFQETELYRACRGQAGGVSREQFESEVLELDQQAYPPLQELPPDHRGFICTAELLGTHFVMEAGGLVTPAREEKLLDFFELKPKRLAEIAQRLGWQRTEDSNTESVLENYMSGRNKHLANLHAVQILRTAFRFVVEEHGGEVPVQFQPAFYTLGSHCQLLKCEVNAIYEIVVAQKPEEQEHEEHEE